MRLSGKKSEIAALDALMCLFVVFIHASAAPINELDRQGLRFAFVFFPWRMLAINVPGFLFLGGIRMFLNRPGRRDYKRFYISRLVKVILPYIIANVIYFVYFSQIGYISFSIPDLLRYIIDGSLSAPFYFVVVITQFYILAPLWDYLIKRVDALPLLITAALFTFLCRTCLPDMVGLLHPGAQFYAGDKLFASYLFFWLAGCYAGLHYGEFIRLITRSRVFITVTFALAAALEAVFSYLRYRDSLYMPFLETIHYIYCVSAVFFLYMLALLFYEKRELKNRLVTAVSRASYNIYLTHSLIIIYIGRFMTAHGFFGVARRYLAGMPSAFVITVTICLFYRRLKEKMLDLLRVRIRRRDEFRIHK